MTAFHKTSSYNFLVRFQQLVTTYRFAHYYKTVVMTAVCWNDVSSQNTRSTEPHSVRVEWVCSGFLSAHIQQTVATIVIRTTQ